MKKYLLIGALMVLGATSYGNEYEEFVRVQTPKPRVDLVLNKVAKVDKDIVVRDIVILKDNENVSLKVDQQSGYKDGSSFHIPQIELNVHKSEQDDEQSRKIESLQDTKVDKSEFEKIKSTLNTTLEQNNEKQVKVNEEYKSKIDGLAQDVKQNKSDIADLNNGVRANANSIIENKIAQDRVNEEHKSQLEELNTKTDSITHSMEQNKEEQKITDNKQTSDIAINSQKIEENKATQDKVNQQQSQINQHYQTQLGVHDNRIANLEQKVIENSNRIDKLSNKLDAVGAMSSAMSGVTFGELHEGEVAVGVGYGFFNDTNAVAVGVATGMTDNITVNAKISATNGHHSEYSASCGIMYKWSFR